MPDDCHPLEKRDVAAAIALATLVLLAGLQRMAPGVCGAFHDDAIYVSTAEALATGQGYRLIDVPGAPLQTKYPPLYPVILSIVWSIAPSFPANLVAMQLVTLSFGAAAVALAYLYLVRFGYCSRNVALAAGLVCATSPYFLYFAVQTMAEMPFALFSIAALWRIESATRQSHTPWAQQLATGVVIALPFLCRTIGLALVAACLWSLWLHRRPIAGSLLGAAAVIIPWFLWSSSGHAVWNQSHVEGYYTDYFGCWSTTGLALFSRVAWLNAIMVAYGSAMAPLQGIANLLETSSPELAHARMLLAAAGLAAWLAVIPGLLRRRPLAWMMAANLAAIIVWPWPPYRFLVPLLPFVCAYLLSWLPGPSPHGNGPTALRIARTTALAAILLTNLWLLSRHAAQVQAHGYPLARLDDQPVQWSSYQRTFAWLRHNSAPDDVVAAGLDSMVALYADRPAFRPFTYQPGALFYSSGSTALLTSNELAAILKRQKPQYLVMAPMPGFAEEAPFAAALDDLRNRHPDWLPPVYKDADSRFTILKVDVTSEPKL